MNIWRWINWRPALAFWTGWARGWRARSDISAS
jgi:hypothetical protein